MIVNTDIDIDIADRNKLLQCIPHTPAMMNSKGKQQKHNTGVYFHKVPENPFTQNCTVDFKKAEELGYFKLDILNVNVYDGINNIDELNELLDMEPMWELLEHQDVVKKCFHIHNHYPVVKQMEIIAGPEVRLSNSITKRIKRRSINLLKKGGSL